MCTYTIIDYNLFKQKMPNIGSNLSNVLLFTHSCSCKLNIFVSGLLVRQNKQFEDVTLDWETDRIICNIENTENA